MPDYDEEASTRLLLFLLIAAFCCIGVQSCVEHNRTKQQVLNNLRESTNTNAFELENQ